MTSRMRSSQPDHIHAPSRLGQSPASVPVGRPLLALAWRPRGSPKRIQPCQARVETPRIWATPHALSTIIEAVCAKVVTRSNPRKQGVMPPTRRNGPGTGTAPGSPGFQTASSAAGASGEPSLDRQLLLDVTELVLDIAGFFDPTGMADGASAVLQASQGEWGGALLSAISIIPYVGDLAKTGKVSRYLRTIERAAAAAGRSPHLTRRLIPVFEKLEEVLRFLPVGVDATIDRLRAPVADFLRRTRAARVVDALPDVSHTFRFHSYERGAYRYHEASGRLGVPGKVKRHRSQAAQRSVSGGTGDDAGHLIGDRFGAPGGTENLSLQNWVSNRTGTFHDLENRWAELLESGHGVRVRVVDVFRRGETRPAWRKVEWTEIAPDGSSHARQLEFMNTHTNRSRLQQGVEPTPDLPAEGATVYDFTAYRQRRGE